MNVFFIIIKELAKILIKEINKYSIIIKLKFNKDKSNVSPDLLQTVPRAEHFQAEALLRLLLPDRHLGFGSL